MSQPIRPTEPLLIRINYKNFSETEEADSIEDFEEFWDRLRHMIDFVTLDFVVDVN